MTLKVRGIPPKDKIWLGKCVVCSSEYEAPEGELKMHDGDQLDPPYGTADCEVCKGKQSIHFYNKK